MTAEIYHLYHSGVVVDIDDSLMIFDYYNDQPSGKERKLENGVLGSKDFVGKENVYVFVSHDHPDHFNQVIFDWQQEKNDIKYILSNDLKETQDQKMAKKNNSRFKQVTNNDSVASFFLSQEQKIDMVDLSVQTYGSTDKGVSFLIKTDKLNVFHSGDLNWWHWKDNSEREQELEAENFKREIDKFKDESIDIAFVPVDPRLEEFYYLAGEYFIKVVKPRIFVPIHFSDNYQITKKFKAKMIDLPTEVVQIKRRGQQISYSK
jgi:L-ascorbate metabolism protein UlaG (beta-lactamase superfamily)